MKKKENETQKYPHPGNEECCLTEEEQTLCTKYRVEFCVDIRNCEVVDVSCNT